jgi:hypothetical protein
MSTANVNQSMKLKKTPGQIEEGQNQARMWEKDHIGRKPTPAK